MPRGGVSVRRVGEVEPARLAAVALLATHQAVLDVLPAPAPLAPQPHRPAPSAIPPPTDMGDLRCLKTLRPSSSAPRAPPPRSGAAGRRRPRPSASPTRAQARPPPL